MADLAQPAYLHLEVGRRAPLRKVIDAERDFYDLARGVAREVAGANPFDWILDQVSETKYLRFRITPDLSGRNADPVLARNVVDVVAKGVEYLDSNPSPPDFFSHAALQSVQALASRQRELNHVAIKNGSHGAEINARLVANLAIVLRPSFTEYGSIEGRLEGLNIHQKSRYFRIYDPLTNHGIRCHFGSRITLDDILSAVGRRVAVGGEIDYREDGNPQDCRAEDLYIFPREEELPDIGAMRGLLRDA